jgi:hypothetical protein
MAAQSGLAAALDDGTDPGQSLRDQVEPAGSGDLFGDAVDECSQAAGALGFSLPSRGPGRPPGARNRSTELTKKVIRSIGGDPHLAAGQLVAGGPLAVLEMAKAAHLAAYGAGSIDANGMIAAGEAGRVPVLAVKDAIMAWQRAAEFLGPYMMPKEALKVAFDAEGLNVTIHLGGGIDAAPADIGGEAARAGGYALSSTITEAYDDEADEVARGSSRTDEPSD